VEVKKIKKKRKYIFGEFQEKKVWLQNEVAFAETPNLSDPQITLEETNKQTHKQHSRLEDVGKGQIFRGLWSSPSTTSNHYINEGCTITDT